MAVALARNSTVRGRGYWWPVWDSGQTTPTTAAFSCPVCSRWNYLNLHTIAADGTVTPLVVCGKDGCDFKDMLVLTGWNPTELSPVGL
jgi:hypothetical protein